jgi:hypothetical protein
MEDLIQLIRKLTTALPDAADVKANPKNYTARDWAGFFAALGDLAKKLIPLLIPLFVATTDDAN